MIRNFEVLSDGVRKSSLINIFWLIGIRDHALYTYTGSAWCNKWKETHIFQLFIVQLMYIVIIIKRREEQLQPYATYDCIL